MTTQRHEIEAWLGDDHGLTDDQVDELARISDEIYERYCAPDDDVDDPEMVEADLAQASQDERDDALTTAYQLLLGEPNVTSKLASDLVRARQATNRALAGLRQAARMTVAPAGDDTEAGFARLAGVDRMTVRKWLGK